MASGLAFTASESPSPVPGYCHQVHAIVSGAAWFGKQRNWLADGIKYCGMGSWRRRSGVYCPVSDLGRHQAEGAGGRQHAGTPISHPPQSPTTQRSIQAVCKGPLLSAAVASLFLPIGSACTLTCIEPPAPLWRAQALARFCSCQRIGASHGSLSCIRLCSVSQPEW